MIIVQLLLLASMKAGSLKVTGFSATTETVQRNKISIQHDEPLLREMQKKHRPIAASFVPTKFNPHPALSNRHLQTISGVFLRKDLDCAYVGDSGLGGLVNVVLHAMSRIDPSASEAGKLSKCDQYYSWDERQRIETSCGEDFFHVDIKYASVKKTTYQSHDSKGMVILVRGLEGNFNSSLALDLGNAYAHSGFDVVCINFRGCCGTPNDTLGGYHLGFTDDLRHFLKLMSETSDQKGCDKRPIYISGYSLGANVVIKCLGELGEAAYSLYNVHGAAVTGAPFDAERNVKYLDAPGFNRVVYSGNFLKSLKKKVQYQLDRHCESDPFTSAFDYPRTMSAKSIAEFDDAFTAKVYGFGTNLDYYRSNSCYYFLSAVAVPLLVINAGDDPFFDPEFYPVEESVDGGGSAPIKMERTKHGGHLGFMFHQLSRAEKKEQRVSSWMPTELARFISHVHSYHYEH